MWGEDDVNLDLHGIQFNYTGEKIQFQDGMNMPKVLPLLLFCRWQCLSRFHWQQGKQWKKTKKVKLLF